MPLLTQAPKGTQDILPQDSYKWQYVEELLMEISRLYGFAELRTPTFEHTELFSRSVGDTTDVVQKEMYTFNDKGNRSITLRPEGTAGMARAAIENGLFNSALPLKISYLINCFRYEKPQAGRLREFHQFGAEVYGSDSPACDAEVIAMVHEIFDTLGIKELRLELNSIGCPVCRA
ncbi:MAG: ATP phosphoribosyltransferase regulatory subunit, partial [Hydrogenoanaerobacterium sp.]